MNTHEIDARLREIHESLSRDAARLRWLALDLPGVELTKVLYAVHVAADDVLRVARGLREEAEAVPAGPAEAVRAAASEVVAQSIGLELAVHNHRVASIAASLDGPESAGGESVDPTPIPDTVGPAPPADPPKPRRPRKAKTVPASEPQPEGPTPAEPAPPDPGPKFAQPLSCQYEVGQGYEEPEGDEGPEFGPEPPLEPAPEPTPFGVDLADGCRVFYRDNAGREWSGVYRFTLGRDASIELDRSPGVVAFRIRVDPSTLRRDPRATAPSFALEVG